MRMIESNSFAVAKGKLLIKHDVYFYTFYKANYSLLIAENSIDSFADYWCATNIQVDKLEELNPVAAGNWQRTHQTKLFLEQL